MTDAMSGRSAGRFFGIVALVRDSRAADRRAGRLRLSLASGGNAATDGSRLGGSRHDLPDRHAFWHHVRPGPSPISPVSLPAAGRRPGGGDMGQANGPHLLANRHRRGHRVVDLCRHGGRQPDRVRRRHADLACRLPAGASRGGQLLLVDGTHHLRTTHACERGWDVGSFPFRRSRLGSLAWAPASDHLPPGAPGVLFREPLLD